MGEKSDACPSWLEVATQRPVVARSLRVSFVVGTVLVGINHGDALLGSGVKQDLGWKIPLTYLVPYMVSTYAAVDAILSRQKNRDHESGGERRR